MRRSANGFPINARLFLWLGLIVFAAAGPAGLAGEESDLAAHPLPVKTEVGVSAGRDGDSDGFEQQDDCQ